MTEEFSFIDAALTRINPVSPSNLSQLVSEADTSALLEELRRRRSWSRWRAGWRNVVARLGIGLVLVIASAGATAAAISILRSSSSNPSSVACYLTASGPREGVVLAPSSAPLQQCETYWGRHDLSTAGLTFKACVLNNGIVGVFADRGNTNPCARLNLSEFTGYSSPLLSQMDQSLVADLHKLRCPSSSFVKSDIIKKLSLNHVRGWLVRDDLAHAPPGTCATFAFMESSPPELVVTAKYQGPAVSQPPGVTASLAKWREWAKQQRTAFADTNWKRALTTPLCRVLHYKVNKDVSKGGAGVPKGVITDSVSGTLSCSP